MSVRVIENGFFGLRVQQDINGVSRVKNFSYRVPVFAGGTTTWRGATRVEKKEIAVLAKAYDQELQQVQESAKKARKYNPLSTLTNTGVKGISYRIGFDSQKYEVEAFWLRMVVNGKGHTSAARLACRSWEEGWKLIVNKLVKVKELSPSTRRKLLEMIPSERKLRAKR